MIGHAIDIHGDRWNVVRMHIDGGATAWKKADDGFPVEIRFTDKEWRELFPVKVPAAE